MVIQSPPVARQKIRNLSTLAIKSFLPLLVVKVLWLSAIQYGTLK